MTTEQYQKFSFKKFLLSILIESQKIITKMYHCKIFKSEIYKQISPLNKPMDN
jgi:hypothetical protein